MFKKEQKLWLSVMVISLILTVYGVWIDNAIVGEDWVTTLYQSEFSSIKPIHLATWAGFTLLNAGVMTFWVTKNTKLRSAYYMFVIIITASLGMWFVFDAMVRMFDTLPTMVRTDQVALWGREFNIAITMAAFEIAAAGYVISRAFVLVTKASEDMDWNPTVKTINAFRKMDFLIIILFAFVIFTQTWAWIAYETNGELAGIINRRFPVIGPWFQGTWSIIGIIIVRKRMRNEWNWNHNMLTTLILGMVFGYMFHDTMVFLKDYARVGGQYNKAGTWGHTIFADIGNVLMFIQVPLMIVGCGLSVGKLFTASQQKHKMK